MSITRAMCKLLQQTPNANEGGGQLQDIFAMRAPDGQLPPFVIYQRTNNDKWRSFNGPAGITQALYQVDSYAATANDANDLAKKIDDYIDGFRGTVVYDDTTSPVGQIKFASITQQNDLETIDETDEPLLYRVAASYLVTFYP